MSVHKFCTSQIQSRHLVNCVNLNVDGKHELTGIDYQGVLFAVYFSVTCSKLRFRLFSKKASTVEGEEIVFAGVRLCLQCVRSAGSLFMIYQVGSHCQNY